MQPGGRNRAVPAYLCRLCRSLFTVRRRARPRSRTSHQRPLMRRARGARGNAPERSGNRRDPIARIGFPEAVKPTPAVQRRRPGGESPGNCGRPERGRPQGKPTNRSCGRRGTRPPPRRSACCSWRERPPRRWREGYRESRRPQPRAAVRTCQGPPNTGRPCSAGRPISVQTQLYTGFACTAIRQAAEGVTTRQPLRWPETADFAPSRPPDPAGRAGTPESGRLSPSGWLPVPLKRRGARLQ